MRRIRKTDTLFIGLYSEYFTLIAEFELRQITLISEIMNYVERLYPDAYYVRIKNLSFEERRALEFDTVYIRCRGVVYSDWRGFRQKYLIY